MVVTDILVWMAPGFWALPLGVFSVAQTMPITLILGLSRAMARMAPIMVAPPAMSYFIFSILSAALVVMPPVSHGEPLPHSPRPVCSGDPPRTAAPAHNAGAC